jgi:hypothetical protein
LTPTKARKKLMKKEKERYKAFQWESPASKTDW